MSIKHCKLCDRKVEARRQLGVGTLLLAVLTAGLGLLVIPFYAERCPICGADRFKEDDELPSGARGEAIGRSLGRSLRKLTR